MSNKKRSEVKMRRLISIIIILLLLVVLLVMTNPDKENFIDWAVNKAVESSDSEVENFFGDVLGKPLLNATSSRKDYKLFSIFKIDTFNEERVYLGLLKN